ncbi:endonuclease/exonuclease/phosphatase family protein [Aquihabitans sp. McL0605]|uniref:endonuclease/exonuclease/phosphatase family protein n=1 Tax=Aquihabitans sp. McL0605 TaxID=3415671 RepID=UPI003CE7B192
MRVVSFNIHHGTVGRKGPVDPERLGAVCAAFDADVIALQEVDEGTVRAKGRDLAAAAAEAAGMEHVFGSSQRLLGGRYGNALLVRGEIHETAVTRLPKVPRTRFWQEQRTVLEARVTAAQTELWVASTHLAVKAWNNEPQLDFLLEHVRSRPAPLLVLGDFNREGSAITPHLPDGLRLAAHGPTFPVHEPRRMIDHLIHSSVVTVRKAEVRSTEMSDHAALVIDLAVGEG